MWGRQPVGPSQKAERHLPSVTRYTRRGNIRHATFNTARLKPTPGAAATGLAKPKWRCSSNERSSAVGLAARLGTGMLPANSKAAQRNDLNGMGAFASAMAQSPSDASAEEGPLPGDLETARQFGARIAAATARWKHGQVELAKAA